MGLPGAIPMFHRRLMLLGGVIAICMVPPVLRVAQLTLVKGESLRNEAESRLVARRWLPTTRGKILDRHGRILAANRPAYELQVEYPVITGQWAFMQAAKQARKEHKDKWAELSAGQRLALVNELLPHFQKQLNDAWDELARVTGVPREEIEERKVQVVRDVSRAAASITEANRAERQEQLSRGEELAVEVSTAEVQRTIAEQTQSHVILRDIDELAAIKLATDDGRTDIMAAKALPTSKLIDTSTREYPLDEVDIAVDRTGFPGPLRNAQPLTVHVAGVAAHVVGAMRDRVYAEELEARPLRRRNADGTVSVDPGGYTPLDEIGNSGIESSSERVLRGDRGSEVTKLDSGETQTTSPTPGRDVRLTIDAALQARIQAIMSPEAGLAMVQPWQKNKALPVGTALAGACVVIDVESGDILALVSTPSWSRTQLREDPASIVNDVEHQPMLNRAVNRAYPPGSIVKPLILSAAATSGVFNPDGRVECNGHFFPDRTDVFRCWIYKSYNKQMHGSLEATEALMRSCNIFFFTLGQKLGPERITEWFGRFGVGDGAGIKHPDLGVGPQFEGRAEPMATKKDGEWVRRGVTPSESIMMGIGQGPIAWTPLHAADAYATIARRGVRILPRMRIDDPAAGEDLRLNQRAVTLGLRGLERSVGEEGGTGYHIVVDDDDGVKRNEKVFNVPGVHVWGKSGTADSGHRVIDPVTGRDLVDEHGNKITLDHAWFVVLAGDRQDDRPKYAVALVVENGGSGGKVSGPICNQVLRALVEEGYLSSGVTPQDAGGAAP